MMFRRWMIHAVIMALALLLGSCTSWRQDVKKSISLVGSQQRLLMSIEENIRNSFTSMKTKTPRGNSISSPTPSYSGVRNLKTAGQTALKEDGVLQKWNEIKGLSEKDLILESRAAEGVNDDGSGYVKRSKQALELAYRRCEYVTQLFSKTFYTGTSLMAPEARQHVWAIYAWCRRTDDIVDSPRALLNHEVRGHSPPIHIE